MGTGSCRARRNGVSPRRPVLRNLHFQTHVQKVWQRHERRSALARALEERSEYILPARFNETEMPGMSPTIKCVDLTATSPVELARIIQGKLGRRPPIQ